MTSDAAPAYPAARLGPDSDDFHGTHVPDPYRWLENAEAAETQRWVAAQNELTARWLDTADRAVLKSRLAALQVFPRIGAPVERGARLFFTEHDGVLPQPRLCVREGDTTRVLLDPNTLSQDGTVALTGFWPSPGGTRLAYAVSTNGSDWQLLRVRDADTGADTTDVVAWAKFTEVAWLPDESGFFYTRFPQPGLVPPGEEHYSARICLHLLGTPQDADALIYDRPDDREVVPTAHVPSTGRVLIITVHRGASDDSEIHWARLEANGQPMPVFTGFSAAFHVIAVVDGWLYLRTTLGATRGRVMAVHLDEGALKTIVPEQPETLSGARIAGDRLVCSYMRNASDVVRTFRLDGQEEGRLPLPGHVSISGFTAEPESPLVFLRVSSYTSAPVVCQYDTRTGVVAGWPLVDVETAAGTPSQFTTEQIWYESNDGTRVSMFLIAGRGVPRDGERPVLLTAYGGFNIPLTPHYDPGHIAWLERGGLVAVPNLRGGGEYGEAWHEAGMLERKQNVFDDFIAAAEWLMAEGYTRPRRLAIEGGSNGGLLVAAVMVQRPELFGAVVCRVPVADMLRYHLFTVGRFWIPEYGCAEDPAQFPFLYAYSPLHNVRDGVRYPPTLVMTADTDDRVAPGMAKKLAARLQAAAAPGSGPILLRVETKAGHGAGKPIAKLVDEEADIQSFLWRSLQN